MKRLLALLLFVLFSSGCATYTLMDLGNMPPVIIKEPTGNPDKPFRQVIKEGRNVWFYPAFCVLIVPAICIDFVLLPYYFVKGRGGSF